MFLFVYSYFVSYEPLKRSTQCSRCEPGRYQTILAADSCEFCEKGQFQSDYAQTGCILCFEGKFIGCKGGYTCWDCDPGRTSDPLRGGTKCRDEVVQTTQPQIVEASHVYANVSGMCISWRVRDEEERRIEQENSLITTLLPFEFNRFKIEWSIEKTFPRDDEEDTRSRKRTNYTYFDHRETEAPIVGPWQYCFPTFVPVHLEVLHIRIIGVGPVPVGADSATADVQAVGTASLTTNSYATAPKCGDVMYLSQHSYPPNGTGLWNIGEFNRRLDQWRCDPCPTGADCRGPKLWEELYAKYGYMRLGVEDFDERRNAFWKCFKEKACLGGIRDPDPGKKPAPATKHGYVTQVRPMVDCCTAVNPLTENKAACLEDPYTFQSRRERLRGNAGFDMESRGCLVDLSLVDDDERCHVEAGFRLNCSYTTSGKCRLCRKCARGYWEQGVANCLMCPPMIVNLVLVTLAIGFIVSMLVAFLSGALEDSGVRRFVFSFVFLR